MKTNLLTAVSGLALGLALVFLSGCSGIEGVPYRADTPGARIFESRLASTNSPNESGRAIIVPVVAGDLDAAQYLEFSSVQVDVDEKNGEKRLVVYASVAPKKNIWRVSLMKNEKEVHHFLVSNIQHFYGQVVALDPLALDSSLPIPDKIIITRVPPETQ